LLPPSVAEGDVFVFGMGGAYAECLFARVDCSEPSAVHFLDDLLDSG
jgi:hypothetical protein